MNERIAPAPYEPDAAVPPGHTIQKMLDDNQKSRHWLASVIGVPLRTVHELIAGERPITSSTAAQLERVIGLPAAVWSNLEANYRRDKERLGE